MTNNKLFPSAATTDYSLPHLFTFTPPAFTTFDNCIIAFGIVFTVLGGFGNALHLPFVTRSGGLLSYSKFAQNVQCGISVSSRVGMFFLYFPAFLLSLLIVTDESVFSQPRVWVVSLCTCLHFGKRSFEVLFVHVYSGTMPLLSSITIGSYYCLLAYVNIHYAAHSATVHDAPLQTEVNQQAGFDLHAESVIDGMFVGLSLFCVGSLGNFYHHWLLSTLRLPGDTSYKVPMGGLFSNLGGVAAPHYLFELVAWVGVSILTKHWVSVLFTFGMVCYLVDRAMAQNEWNRKNLKDKYPASRKNIVPYLF